jgi:hypothetical protein
MNQASGPGQAVRPASGVLFGLKTFVYPVPSLLSVLPSLNLQSHTHYVSAYMQDGHEVQASTLQRRSSQPCFTYVAFIGPFISTKEGLISPLWEMASDLVDGSREWYLGGEFATLELSNGWSPPASPRHTQMTRPFASSLSNVIFIGRRRRRHGLVCFLCT